MTPTETPVSLLNATHIGKRITVEVRNGATVTDTLIGIINWAVEIFGGDGVGETRTLLQFANTRPVHLMAISIRPEIAESFFEVDGATIAILGDRDNT